MFTMQSKGSRFCFVLHIMAGLLAFSGVVFAKTPPAPPAAGAPQKSADTPPGYRIVHSTAYGKSLVGERANAPSVRAALLATFKDLSQYFGAQPTIRVAYEDARDHRSGAAAFAVSWQNHAYKGLVIGRLKSGGARVLVVFAQSNTPRPEWAKLWAAPQGNAKVTGGQAAAAGTGAVATANGPAGAPRAGLKVYRFPDGTGLVGLIDGWRVNAPSCKNGFVIQGPGDQTVSLGSNIRVVLPNSPLASTLGSQFPVAPIMAPRDALRYLTPQVSRISVKQGGPALAVDNIVERRDMKPLIPINQSSVVLAYGVTLTTRSAGQKHYQVLSSASTIPMQGEWSLAWHELRAPDATFTRDLPAMQAMAESWRINTQVINQKSQQSIAQQQQWFESQQKMMKAQYERNYAANRRWEQNEYAPSRTNNAASNNTNDASLEQSRGFDDFDEYLRGQRTVEDTQTGLQTSVDLGNVDQIVDGLNTGQEGRYKQIPLRDEAHPLPGNGE